MTILAAVALASFLFKDDDFFGARLSDNFAGDFGVGDQRRTNFDLAIAADKQNILENHFGANFAGEFFDFDDIAFGNAILLATGSNYCIFQDFVEIKFLKENPSKVN